ncbi:hypothetical protein ASC94_12875 [Massilia sp. Root418]|jgi:hypothetical protein|uniref:hypothetical protein n=1 Tax=Massilia sp. Root418 TaxID=1736532 RepID=UPI0006F5A57F|nr:hypothetical protein [Massilia sp. Root418]KQW93516.1 hypothetical protein ASC94_12875 [Massilia sp. Root418]
MANNLRGPRTILVQTTIPTTTDDWSIARFSLLVRLLAEQRDAQGQPAFKVIARDRDPGDGPDSVLSRLGQDGIDVLWLMAVDTGAGLHAGECEAIERFRRRGGGLLVARDHMDLGSSVCGLGGVGAAHHFHTVNPEADPDRQVNDDTATGYIHWPNYHSGRNGDYQELTVAGPVHPVLADPASPTGAIRFLPAHPHEGAVSAPQDEPARVIATGRSLASGAQFNLAVAFERSEEHGRAIAQSSFHHFCDYNWDTAAGCPAFVSEAPGDGMAGNPAALRDVQRYVVNAAHWLAGR